MNTLESECLARRGSVAGKWSPIASSQGQRHKCLRISWEIEDSTRLEGQLDFGQKIHVFDSFYKCWKPTFHIRCRAVAESTMPVVLTQLLNTTYVSKRHVWQLQQLLHQRYSSSSWLDGTPSRSQLLPKLKGTATNMEHRRWTQSYRTASIHWQE